MHYYLIAHAFLQDRLFPDELKEKSETSMTSKALWKEHPTCAQTCALFRIVNFYYRRCSELSHTGKDADWYQPAPLTASLYSSRFFPKLPLILSSANRQPSYQEDMRLKAKKGDRMRAAEEERHRERGRKWKCVDGKDGRRLKLTAEKLENVD